MKRNRTESWNEGVEDSQTAKTFCACYRALGQPLAITLPTPEIARAVNFIYGEMRAEGDLDAAFPIDIAPVEPGSPVLQVSFDGDPWFQAQRLGDLLHQLDNHLTIALEHMRPDLYFVHAAALEAEGRVTLLVGDSGAGKSTTCYGLAAAGAGYLTDELAAIEPATFRVHPYPRAICLKKDPPAPLTLPKEHLRTEWTIHARASDLGAPVPQEGGTLSQIIFLRWSPHHKRPELREVSRGEASLRLYQGALNQLAHPSYGLDDTLRLCERADCLELLSAEITETVALVRGSSRVPH